MDSWWRGSARVSRRAARPRARGRARQPRRRRVLEDDIGHAHGAERRHVLVGDDPTHHEPDVVGADRRISSTIRGTSVMWAPESRLMRGRPRLPGPRRHHFLGRPVEARIDDFHPGGVAQAARQRLGARSWRSSPTWRSIREMGLPGMGGWTPSREARLPARGPGGAHVLARVDEPGPEAPLPLAASPVSVAAAGRRCAALCRGPRGILRPARPAVKAWRGRPCPRPGRRGGRWHHRYSRTCRALSYPTQGLSRWASSRPLISA